MKATIRLNASRHSSNFLAGWIRTRLAGARLVLLCSPVLSIQRRVGVRLFVGRRSSILEGKGITRSSPNYGALPSGKEDLHPGRSVPRCKDPSINRLLGRALPTASSSAGINSLMEACEVLFPIFIICLHLFGI